MLKRKLILGDEWIYVKIYTGQMFADKLLVTHWFPLVRQFLVKKLICEFFFLRYIDADGFHLRFRFLVSSSTDIGYVINMINLKFNKLTKDNLITRVVYDTYNREFERYGEKYYIDTENLFFIDSLYTLNLLSHIQTITNMRWMCAIALIDDTLNSFGYSIADKAKYANWCKNLFRSEFNIVDKGIVHAIDAKYRENKLLIDQSVKLLLPDNCKNEILSRRHAIIVILNKYNSEAQILCDEFISDFNHMTINRFFISENRKCEWILYEYLSKYYDSEIARNKFLN